MRPLFYINSANELIHGSGSLPNRQFGTLTVFDHGVRPGTDNVYDYGSATYRGRTAYFGTGTINTSDERNKPIIERIPDSLLDAWAEVDWGNRFKFDDAITGKGADGARWHFGLIAQWVRDVLMKHGIDGFTLGLLCYDEWDDVYTTIQTNDGEQVTRTRTIMRPLMECGEDGAEPVARVVSVALYNADGTPKFNEDGTRATKIETVLEEVEEEYLDDADPEYETVLELAAGNRWGIRPDQCLFVEAAYQRRRCDRIEARLSAAGL